MLNWVLLTQLTYSSLLNVIHCLLHILSYHHANYSHNCSLGTILRRQERNSLSQWLLFPRLMELRLAHNIHHLTRQFLWEVAELKTVEAVVKSGTQQAQNTLFNLFSPWILKQQPLNWISWHNFKETRKLDW